MNTEQKIKPQGIVDKINANTITIMTIKKQIGEYEKEIQESLAYNEKKKLEDKLKEIQQQDSEIREQGKNILLEAGMKKFEALDGTVIQLNKKPGALKIEDDSIPELDEYRKEKVTVSIDKTALKKDIKEGLIIEGVSISEDYKLEIKN